MFNVDENAIKQTNQRMAELEKENRELKAKYKRIHNDLCLLCGNYTDAHKGSCDGCYYKE